VADIIIGYHYLHYFFVLVIRGSQKQSQQRIREINKFNKKNIRTLRGLHGRTRAGLQLLRHGGSYFWSYTYIHRVIHRKHTNPLL